MKLRWAWLTIICGLHVCGCKTPVPAPPPLPSYTVFHAPQLNTIPLRRVVVLPMENYTRHPQAAERVIETVVSDLRAAGLFDLVLLPPNEARQCHDQFALHGSYPEPLLVELAIRHRADGVMFSSLNTYDPYWPPRVGMNLHIVSTQEDITLVSVDGLWDAREAWVASQAEAFYGLSSAEHHIPRPELAVYSPEQFERFVARQVLQAIAQPASDANGEVHAEADNASTTAKHRWRRTPLKTAANPNGRPLFR